MVEEIFKIGNLQERLAVGQQEMECKFSMRQRSELPPTLHQ